MRRPARLAAVLVLVACASPTPPTLAPAPSHPVATAPADPTAAVLQIKGMVRDGCGSIGGCAYFAQVADDDDRWRVELAVQGERGGLSAADGLPATLPAGDYTVTLTSQFVSDLILNGVRKLEGEDTRCVAAFTVAPGQGGVNVLVTYDADECSVEITGS